MNLLDLAVKLTCEDEATDEVQSASENISNKWGAMAKAGAAAMAALYTAASAVTAGAVKAYSSYEQLVGGVETLFGESSGKLIEYANGAYATAGMSANQYMETATSFSASLLQSLGNDTAAAVEYADRAITDMSDNANKMGTDMESIQNAYQGFAKQNYTMLDNLKLGYGGTKEEMERLIEDANRLRESQGMNADLTIDSYADVVEAIHTVQVEMGISGVSAREAAELVASGAMTEEEAFEAMGTTAKESMTTIEGSLNSTKAAWENWLVGLADGTQDIGFLTTNLVNMVSNTASLILPRVMNVIGRLMTELPSALNQILPIVINSVMEIIPALVEMIPQFLDVALQMFITLIQALDEVIPQLIEMLPELIGQIVEVLTSNAPLILEAGFILFISLVQAFLEMLPQLIEQLPSMIDQITGMLIEFVPLLSQAAIILFMAIVEAVPQILESLLSAVGSLIGSIPSKIDEFFGEIYDAGVNLMQGFIDGVGSLAGSILDAVLGPISDAIDGAKKLLGIASPSKVFKSIGMFSMEGLSEGFDDGAYMPINSLQDTIDKLSNPISIGINSVASKSSAGTVINNYYSIDRIDVTGDSRAEEAINYLTSYSRRVRTAQV